MAIMLETATLNNINVRDQADVKDLAETVEDISERLDPAAERRLVRKIDLRLIPILFVLYLCAFIDRYIVI